MKPSSMRNKMMYLAPMHHVSRQLAAPLSDELQQKYRKSSARVVEGDSVKVLRGEFKGVEGKVTSVSTLKRGVAIEGIKREKLKGGNVDIYIHPSNVMITALNLEDGWRQSKLEGKKPKVEKPKKAEEKTEAVRPKEQEAEKPEEKKEEASSTSKQKETKTADKTEKTEKKTPKTKKSDK